MTDSLGDEALLGFSSSDQEQMRDFWAVYDAHYEQVSADLRRLLNEDPEFGPMIQSMPPEIVAEQRRESREMLRRAIVEDEWRPYLERLRAQGAQYSGMGLSFKAWFKAVGAFRPFVLPHLVSAYGEDYVRLMSAVGGMDKFIDTAMAAIGEAYLKEKERTIKEQQGALRELSTPVLQVREGLLILPIVGLLDSQRAQQLTEQLLRAIRAHRAKAVILDITGVPAVDSRVANHLLQTVDAARLMGANVVVTGLSPEIARTLVSLGIDLGRMKTVGDLQGGIEEVEQILGYRLIREDKAERFTLSDEESA